MVGVRLHRPLHDSNQHASHSFSQANFSSVSNTRYSDMLTLRFLAALLGSTRLAAAKAVFAHFMVSMEENGWRILSYLEPFD